MRSVSRQGGNLNNAYQLAIDVLTKTDLECVCNNSGASFKCIADSVEAISVRYLNRSYLIHLPSFDFSYLDCTDEVPLKTSIVILHYLNIAKGTPPSHTLIDFRKVAGGLIYYPVFTKRVYEPFLKRFALKPDLLFKAAAALGGYKEAGLGDLSVTIPAFPRVHITFVVYEADAEFDASCTTLFDSNIVDYLSPEDIIVVCEDIIRSLIKY